MRANQIKLYDLEAVNTTIVLRELVPNPDLITICLHDLQAVATDIVLREIPCIASAAASYYGILKYWTGAVWERALLKAYGGSFTAGKPLKLWDGATWQDIDATG